MQYRNISERLKKIRKELNLSQTDFGKRLGKNYHSVMRWELGKVSPPANVLDHISDIFNINRVWLDTGEGDIFNAKINTSLKEQESIKYSIENTSEFASLIPKSRIELPDMPQNCIVIKAPKGSTPPVINGDLIFIESLKNADNDGLYLVSDQYGDYFIRYFISSKALFISKQVDYPDIPLNDAKVKGKIVKIVRDIPF